MQNHYYVYILASRRNGTLYVGMTNDIIRRVWEHKNDVIEGFTKKYAVHTLVYFDVFNSPTDAIIYEKRLKRWHRRWKLDLIEKHNPTWRDLFDDFSKV